MKHGYLGFKTRFGFGPTDGAPGMRENIKRVEALREVLGYDVDLMLECYMGWNLDHARRMLPRLARFEPRWLEEPVFDVEVGNELFNYIFKSDPEAVDGFLHLDDRKPGVGITITDRHLLNFEITG